MEKYLTIPDLMERWQCSYATAWRAMHSKALRAIKPKRRLLARLKDVERYEELTRVHV